MRARFLHLFRIRKFIEQTNLTTEKEKLRIAKTLMSKSEGKEKRQRENGKVKMHGHINKNGSKIHPNGFRFPSCRVNIFYTGCVHCAKMTCVFHIKRSSDQFTLTCFYQLIFYVSTRLRYIFILFLLIRSYFFTIPLCFFYLFDTILLFILNLHSLSLWVSI